MSAIPPFAVPYLNDAKSQLDGTRYAMANCVIVVACALINVASLGYWKISASSFRVATRDTSGGISYDQAVETAPKVTRSQVRLWRLYWVPNRTLRDVISAKKVAGISIWTRRLLNTPWALSGSFGHTVEVGGIFTDSRGVARAWVMDPGHTDAEWEAWPLSLLVNCANDRTGEESIHLLYTRDLTDVSRPVMSRRAIRNAPAVITGNKVGVVDPAKTDRVRVVTTVRGGEYDTGRGYKARGWSKLGDKKYVIGLGVR